MSDETPTRYKEGKAWRLKIVGSAGRSQQEA